jgi:hypothetical protein
VAFHRWEGRIKRRAIRRMILNNLKCVMLGETNAIPRAGELLKKWTGFLSMDSNWRGVLNCDYIFGILLSNKCYPRILRKRVTSRKHQTFLSPTTETKITNLIKNNQFPYPPIIAPSHQLTTKRDNCSCAKSVLPP